jgi:hypothetical protein
MKIRHCIETAIIAGLLCFSSHGVLAGNVTESKVDTAKKEAANSIQVPWGTLPHEVKSVLAQVETKWATLVPEKQRLLIAGANRWLSLNSEQKQEFTQRYKRWYQLPEGKREYFADLWSQYKQLSPYKQNRIRIAFKRFNRMPESKREQLWAQWRQLPSEQRDLYRQQTFGVVGSVNSKSTAAKRTTVSKQAVFPIVKSDSSKKKD